MALPKPKNKEKKSDFVSRCISEVAKDPKFKDNKQRIAICYTQFDQAKSEAAIIGGADEEEFLVFAEMKMPMEKTCAQCGGPMTTTKEGLAVCKSKATCAPKKSMSAEEPSKQEKSPMHEKNPKDPKEDKQEGEMHAQKTYKGQKRSELKDSDFLFPDKRSFPIVTPQDVRDAISNFGRMGGEMSYDAFIKKLYQKAKSKGPEFVAAIPESTKKQHKLSTAQQMDLNAPEMEEETPDQELLEMKKDLYEMAVASIMSIKSHAEVVLGALNDLTVQDNLTETWMQGKLAIAEDYMVNVHNYVMFNVEN